ncbi:MAG: phospholipase D-like domain-containing protein, partial [Turicibacter sp.]
MNVIRNCITGDQDFLYDHLKDSFSRAVKVDIIVSFLMESGVKLIAQDLKALKDRGVSIRILTGNYMNVTQPSALYLLKDILGDEVDLRFYNDPSRSFHAKSYFIEYETG